MSRHQPSPGNCDGGRHPHQNRHGRRTGGSDLEPASNATKNCPMLLARGGQDREKR